MTPWIITILTTATVYVLDRWENRLIQSVFDWFPSILLAYVIPATISAIYGLDFSSDGIHEYSKLFFIPMAIITVMSSLSIVQLRHIGWRPILLFGIGSLWIAIFPVLFVLLFSGTGFVENVLIGEQYWMGVPPIVGSWIGGSTSQLVLKELVGCPENIFLTILVIDNVLVNIWTILMFQSIKRSESINTLMGIHNSDRPMEIQHTEGAKVSIWISMLLLVAVVLLSNYLISSFIMKVVILSIMGLIISNAIPRWNHTFSLQLGGVLILIVMAILGLKLHFDTFSVSSLFIIFLIVWLVGHLFIMLLFAKVLSVHSAWVPIASMANVGGIATAPAVTAAYNKEWMPHAVILAILSMATGTFWGMLTIYLLRLIIG